MYLFLSNKLFLNGCEWLQISNIDIFNEDDFINLAGSCMLMHSTI